jgi:hypothetical protein
MTLERSIRENLTPTEHFRLLSDANAANSHESDNLILNKCAAILSLQRAASSASTRASRTRATISCIKHRTRSAEITRRSPLKTYKCTT